MKLLTSVGLVLALAMLSACVPSTPSGFSLPLAKSVTFTYTSPSNPANPALLFTAEGAEFMPAANEASLTEYQLYWGNAFGEIDGYQITSIPVQNNGEKIVFRFADGASIPKTAQYLLVCSANATGTYCGPSFNVAFRAAAKIRDVDLLQMGQDLNTATTILNNTSEASCPGYEVSATCGNGVCETAETIDNCRSDCASYHYASYNLQTLCEDVQNVYHPTTVSEVISIVNNAVVQGQRIKVAGAGHSDIEVMCTDGVIIQTDQLTLNNPNMTIALEVYEGREVVNVPAGTLMWDLSEWLHQRGRSIGYVHLGFRYATVAGLMSTAAHGSSPRNPNVVAHRVASLDVVRPDGVLQTYSQGTTGVTNPDLWAAMKVGLGYFGVITSMRVEVMPTTNLHARVTFHPDSQLFNSPTAVFDQVKDCDFGQMNWFPSVGKFVRTCGLETSAAEEPGAAFMLLKPEPNSALTNNQVRQIFQTGACNPDGAMLPTMARLNYQSMGLYPPYIKEVNGVVRRTTDVIGPQHQLITGPGSQQDDFFVNLDYEIAIPHQNIQAALEYSRDVLRGQNSKARNLTLPLIGMFIRFTKSEDGTLMAYHGTGGLFEDNTHVMHVELAVMGPAGFSQAQLDEYLVPYEELVTGLITQFGGRPHWGKNHLWEHELALQSGAYTENNRLQRFRAQVAAFDPDGVFANPFAKMIGISYPNFSYPVGW